MADTLTLSGPGSSSLFELLVHTVRDYAIFALDTGGTIVSWNRGAEQLKGYPAGEAIGHHFSMFFTAADREAGAPQQLLAEARERGSAAVEAWRVRRDGTLFWASVVVTALHAADGSLIGFAKVTRDLTQRREAEETLRLRERQLADAQELAGLGSWEWDVAADRVTWSDELYRIYGLEPQSFGANFPAYLERVHPDDRERVQNLIRSAVAAGGHFEFEERIVRPDGEERVLRSRGRVIRDASGSTTHLMGACIDITDLARAQEQSVELARQEAARHAAEASAQRLAELHSAVAERNARLEDQAAELEMQTEELQEQARQTEQLMEELRMTNEALQERTQEAEQANRVKSEFLAAMSHELRTPLNAIFGYADLLDLGIHGPITPKQAEALERIKRNQRALLGLINDVLSFARIDAGRLELKIEDVRVCDVIADLEPLIEPQLLERELSFEARACPPALRVRAERERVDQILLNLLTNAMKFTPAGGSICVEAQADGDTVLLRVIDSGCGIAPERAQSIFDPFVQGQQRSGRLGERGVGLGLAISRELAHAMGGTLTVESEPGRGSTFTLTLPGA